MFYRSSIVLCTHIGGLMSDEQIKEDLAEMLVNGINLDFMGFTTMEQLEVFGLELVDHYKTEDKLQHLQFWLEDLTIKHEQDMVESTFTVVLSEEGLGFRLAENNKQALQVGGQILMATVRFIGYKLEQIQPDGFESVEEPQPVLDDSKEEDSEDYWL